MPQCNMCNCAIDIEDTASYVSFLVPYVRQRKWLVRQFQCSTCNDRVADVFEDDSDYSSDEEAPMKSPGKRFIK